MTDIGDFSETIRRIVERSRSISEVERRLGRELTAGQVAVIAEYYRERQRQEQMRAERIRRVELAQRIARTRIIIYRDRLGRRHARDRLTGRFMRLRRR